MHWPPMRGSESTTCALISTRPSSNTWNRPTGPAPTITASVSIGPASGTGRARDAGSFRCCSACVFIRSVRLRQWRIDSVQVYWLGAGRLTSRRNTRSELDGAHREKAAHVAHVRVCGERPVCEGVIGRHVGDIDDQHEVRTGGDAVALLDRGLGNQVPFELLEQIGRLPLERDFDDHGQARGQRLVRDDRHLPFDHAFFDQPPHTTQAGRGRYMNPLCQFLVGQRAVDLQLAQNAPVRFVDRCHVLYFIYHVVYSIYFTTTTVRNIHPYSG